MELSNISKLRSLYEITGDIRDINNVIVKLDELNQLVIDHNSRQAKIDLLMLEFCPNEMTKEQLIEWRLNQKLFEG